MMHRRHLSSATEVSSASQIGPEHSNTRGLPEVRDRLEFEPGADLSARNGGIMVRTEASLELATSTTG